MEEVDCEELTSSERRIEISMGERTEEDILMQEDVDRVRSRGWEMSESNTDSGFNVPTYQHYSHREYPERKR